MEFLTSSVYNIDVSLMVGLMGRSSLMHESDFVVWRKFGVSSLFFFLSLSTTLFIWSHQPYGPTPDGLREVIHWMTSVDIWCASESASADKMHQIMCYSKYTRDAYICNLIAAWQKGLSTSSPGHHKSFKRSIQDQSKRARSTILSSRIPLWHPES